MYLPYPVWPSKLYYDRKSIDVKICLNLGRPENFVKNQKNPNSELRFIVLEYSCEVGDRSEASKIEYQVKSLSKNEKEELVAGKIELYCLLQTKA